MTGDGVGHAGAEPQTVGGLGGQREPDVRIAGKILRVHHEQAVEARGLRPLGLTRRHPGHAGPHGPDLDAGHPAIITERVRAVSAGASRRREARDATGM